jgi:serine/threonine-protein kinase
VIGERYGNYRAIALLGEGGMGAVFLAEHPEIGRRVAVKVLRSEMDHDPQLLTRFLNEARAANAIRHPNIIEVLDSGTTERGASYLVMELLEGESLSSRIHRLVRFGEMGAAEIVLQTALGLGAAHAKGIVHRDLKPDNLFLIPEPTDPSRERVKILDFGIAKLHRLGGDSLKTRTGTLMGTPVYMSPEQCLGTKEVDHRSDVYSLGIILYEMLAGRPPFLSEGFGELLSMHLQEQPPALSSLVQAITPEMEAVVQRMLAKKADERFQSMAEVRMAVASAANIPIAVSPEHKLGQTDPLASAATQVVPSGPVRTGTPSTITPGGVTRTGRAETTIKVGGRRRWLTVGIAAAVVLSALAAVLAMRQPSAPARPEAKPVALPAVTPPPPPPPVQAPTMIRLRLESAPAGARVVRVSDGAVLGTTPETIELRPSAEPMQLRVEKDGFVPATRDVSLSADGHLSVVLAAAPPERPAPVKRQPSAKPREKPSHDEPAKL